MRVQHVEPQRRPVIEFPEADFTAKYSFGLHHVFRAVAVTVLFVNGFKNDRIVVIVLVDHVIAQNWR